MFLFRIFKNHPVATSIIILSFFFFAFYPSNYTTIDEHSYVSNSVWIREGILKQTCNSDLPGQYKVSDYCVYKYNIGLSIIFIPFTAFGYQSVFIPNFLFFIGSIFIFSKLLEAFKLRKEFIYFFAFFPSIVFYSRTALSEIPSLFFTLLFTLSLMNLKANTKKAYIFGILAGLSLGISLFIKYTNIVHLTAILGVIYYKELIKFSYKKVFFFCLGSIPLFVALIILNTYLYKGPFNSGYFYANEQVFSINYFINHFWPYIIVLSLFYPLMLPLSFYKNKLNYLIIPVLLSIIAYSSSKNTLFEGRVLDLVFGIRFIIPVIPLMFISYFDKLEIFFKYKIFKTGLVISIAFLILSALGISISHYNFLNENYKQRWVDVGEYVP